MKPRITYVFHGRFPDPRAAALFACEEAISFARAGAEVEIIVPRRRGTNVVDARRVHHIPESVRITILPAFDYFDIPFVRAIAFRASMLSFARSLRRHLRDIPPSWVVVVDPLFASVARERGHQVLLEVHDFPTHNAFWAPALREATLVLATNRWKADALVREWQVRRERIVTESNGVDLAAFSTYKTTGEARATLPELRDVHGPVAVYTGNLYDWKGTDTLIDAARLIPEWTICLVGGAPDHVERVRAHAPKNVLLIGRVPHERIPLWQAAADVLVLPNTATEEISVHYTSPLKLFEYMASGRPVVASELPSIREVLPEDAGYYVRPDDPAALAEGIAQALSDPSASAHADRARTAVASHSWDARARRILAHLSL